MVSMKRESDKPEEVATAAEDGSYYPHTLYLDDADVKKLGLSGAEVGKEYVLVAKCEITEYGFSERGDKEREHMTLTIEEAEIKSRPRTDKERAETIYRS